VPECVPPKSCFNSQFPNRWSQMLLQNCLPPIRLHSMAMPACKNPVVRLLILGLFFPLDECFADPGDGPVHASEGFCITRPHEAVDDSAHHVHCCCRKIDVAPLQREQLALSNAS